jgi:potassium efflux system protein
LTISTLRPCRAIAALALVLFALPAWAAPAAAPKPLVTPESVASAIQEIEAREGLDEALRTKLLKTYRRIGSRLDDTRAHESSAAGFRALIASAPKEILEIRKWLETPIELPTTPAELKIEGLGLAALEPKLLLAQSELAGIKADLAGIEKQLAEQQDRPVQIREALAAANRDLEDLDKTTQRPTEPDPSPLLIEARKLSRHTRSEENNQEIKMLEQESASLGLRLQLLSAQRDKKARELEQAEARVQVMDAIIAGLRHNEASRAEIEASRVESEASGKHPAVRRLAEDNAASIREHSALLDQITRADQARAVIEAKTEALKQQFTAARQKLEIAGLSSALGQILRKERRALFDQGHYREDQRDRQHRIGDAGLNQFRLEEERRALTDLAGSAERLYRKNGPVGLSPSQEQGIKDDLRRLLKARQKLLDMLLGSYGGYLRALGDLDFASRQLAEAAAQYARFLDEHLLWIPSAPALGLATVRDLPGALAWLFSPSGWLEVGVALWTQAVRAPVFNLLALGLFLACLRWRRWLKSDLAAIGEKLARQVRFGHTLRALADTLLLELPWPLLSGFLGLRLADEGGELVRAVGAGLYASALPLFLLRALYRLSRPGGVAAVHFRWEDQALALLRRHLAWLMAIRIPLLFVCTAVAAQGDAGYADSLGRLAFMVAMAAVAVFAGRVLRPERGALTYHLRLYPEGWLARLRYLWYPAGVGLPVALGLLAAAGYYETAAELESQLVASLWLALVAVIGHDLVIRWLELENRKLALVKARERREAEAAKLPGDPAGAALEVSALDIPTINAQTRKLLRMAIGMSMVVGLWLTWSQVVPALAILDQVTLWETAAVVDGHEQADAITLANLAMAILLSVAAVVAARNIPGVLEVVLLGRLDMTPGNRYAVSQVARYAIVGLGVLVVFNAIGGSWSQVQWLVAALSVGLGFGLQEIFANFVSGLIILFERPVRIGDTVTVGEVTGTVSRIRIRATTITDGDRRELVVPNKTFITDRVINWTLSDPITRIVIRVGIAYGSDTELAHRVIMDAVRALPLVLAEPEPTVFFVGLGENALDFEVRVFVKEINERMPLTHELHTNIERALQAHGIQIPCPQRDVHVWFMGDPAREAQARPAGAAPQPPIA